MEWVDILPNQTSKRSWRADKLSQIGSSIFAEVSEWKQEAFQAGRHIIDLSIGALTVALPRISVRCLAKKR